MNEDMRFKIIYGQSIIQIVTLMNEHADHVGRLIYIGPNHISKNVIEYDEMQKEAPFVAVFDNMPVLVETIEDQLTFRSETLESLKLKTVITG